MRELTDVLGQALEDGVTRAERLPLASDPLTGVRRRVRRRRVLRHTAEGALLAPAAAVLAAGTWWLVDREEPSPPPVATQTPTPTPTPTAPPETTRPTPTSTPTAPALGEPVVRPGLPPYHPAPDGILDQAGEGWAVTVHRPARYDESSGAVPASDVQALFLVDPEGTRYLLAELPVDTVVRPLSWDAGTERVRVEITRQGDPDDTTGDTVTGWLDLRSATVEEGPDVLPDGASLVGRTADGAELWLDRSRGALVTVGADADVRDVAPPGVRVADALVDPTGTTAVVQVDGERRFDDGVTLLDLGARTLRTVPTTGADEACAPVGWWDDGTLALVCTGPQEGWDLHLGLDPVVHLLDVAGGTTTTLLDVGADGLLPAPFSGRPAEGGLVAGTVDTLPYGCGTGVARWDGDGTARRLLDLGPVNLADLDVLDGRVVVGSSTGCSGDAAPWRVTSVPTRGGEPVVLAPAPEGEGEWVAGVVGWAVAR